MASSLTPQIRYQSTQLFPHSALFLYFIWSFLTLSSRKSSHYGSHHAMLPLHVTHTCHHPQPISYLLSIECSQRLMVPQSQTSSSKYLQAPWRHNSWTEGAHPLITVIEWKTAPHVHLLSTRASKVTLRLKHSKVFNFIINKKILP